MAINSLNNPSLGRTVAARFSACTGVNDRRARSARVPRRATAAQPQAVQVQAISANRAVRIVAGQPVAPHPLELDHHLEFQKHKFEMVKADLVLQIRRLCSSVGEHGVIKKQMASKIEQQAARIAELEQSASGQLKVKNEKLEGEIASCKRIIQRLKDKVGNLEIDLTAAKKGKPAPQHFYRAL